jgi:putative Ca2+/H+ antiporter (TMEM165/GDT1 family)
MIECMTLTFLAEWGDRSQIATIALAAAQNPYGVTLGAVIGHSICTGIAVLGGRILATKISVRNVTVIGGILFILFALADIIQG